MWMDIMLCYQLAITAFDENSLLAVITDGTISAWMAPVFVRLGYCAAALKTTTTGRNTGEFEESS